MKDPALPRLVAYPFALLVVGHAIAHLPGFVVYWPLGTLAMLQYKTAVLGGSLDLGATGMTVFAALWLLAAIGFIGCAAGMLTRRRWWRAAMAGVALVSLVLTVLDWEAASIGAFVNLGILAFLVLTSRLGWRSED